MSFVFPTDQFACSLRLADLLSDSSTFPLPTGQRSKEIRDKVKEFIQRKHEGTGVDLGPREKRSNAWAHFNVLPHQYAECKICLKPISRKSTSALRNHLKTKHDIILDNVNKMSQIPKFENFYNPGLNKKKEDDDDISDE